MANVASVDTYTGSLYTTVIAHISSGDGVAQTNTAPVTATVDETSIAITVVGTNNGLFQNSSNTADARAYANRDGVTVSLATINSTVSADGIGIGTTQSNDDIISSLATGQNLGISSTTFQTGSVDVSSNTVAAITTVNEGSGTYATTVNGAEPIGYANSASGNANVATDFSGGSAQVSAVDGTIAVSSVQITGTTTSNATAGGASSPDYNNITLDLLSTAANTVTGVATVDSNTISATFKANSRTATIGLDSADASVLGTAAISNAQSNGGTSSSADSAALNINSTISANVYSNDTTSYTNAFDGSSLSVSSNTVSSSATGNTVAGTISIADAQTFTAPSNVGSASVGQDDDAALLGDAVDVATAAGLTIGSTQLNGDGTGAYQRAYTLDANIDATVQESINSAIDVSNNTSTAVSTGNSLSNSIASSTGSALFDGSAALGSQQKNNDFSITAQTSYNTVYVTAGNNGDFGIVSDGSITLDANVTAAVATGNTSSQSVALDAVTLTVGAGDVVLTADGTPVSSRSGGSDVLEQYASADGSVVAASVQLNVGGSSVFAQNDHSDIRLTSNDENNVTANMTLAITDGIQQAYAMGSSAANSVSLTGTTVGSEAGAVSYQLNAAGSTVSATTSGKDTIDINQSLGSFADGGSTAELSGNKQQAIAMGGTTTNSVTVDAVSVTVDSNETAGSNVYATSIAYDRTAIASPFDGASSLPTATAAYAALNDQTILADVTAQVNPSIGASYTINANNDLVDSSTTNNTNSMVAQAQGAVSSNSLGLSIDSLSVALGDYATIGALLNAQAVEGANITASAIPNGDAVVRTNIGDEVLSSSITTSSNVVSAVADGAKASNSIAVSATTLNVADGGTAGTNLITPSSLTAGTGTIDAAFAVANAQSGGTGTVEATLNNTSTGSVTDSVLVLTNVGNNVSDSSIASNSNLLRALADSNEAANSLSFDATTLSTTGAVSNAQLSNTDVVASIGFDGSPGVAGFTVTINYTAGAGGDTLDLSSFTPDQRTSALSALGAIILGYNPVTHIATIIDATDLQTGATGASIPAAGLQANTGGVTIAVGGDITSAALEVTGNTVQGSAIGNIGTNTLSATANAIAGDGGFTVAQAHADSSAWTATADYTINSFQTVDSSSSSTTTVYSTFAIDQAPDQTITDSTLAVSSNVQYGEALANTATNTLTVAGNDLDAASSTSAALLNVQFGNTATVSATSDMEVFTNVASSGSTLAMDSNSNTALGVINNASNTLTASATNFTDAGGSAFAYGTDGDWADAYNATFSLGNAQSASGTLNTVATSSIYNNDKVDTSTLGVANGTASLSSNATRAESSANRATNTVSVDGTASLGATAALANTQDSTTTVIADATSTIGFTLTGGTSPAAAVTGGTVAINGNSTTAVARGNSASNVLTFIAGAEYSTPSNAATARGFEPSVGRTAVDAQADAVLVNSQSNTGPVTAQSTGVTYAVALNSGGTGGAALNSTVSVANNSLTALAYGNSATNTVTLAALNTGSPSVGVSNGQFNNGAVQANVSAVNFNIGATKSATEMTVSASSFRNVGNTISAQAAGNSSLTVIGAR